MTELLRGWAVQADPELAADRRRVAEAAGCVLLRRRDDGLADVVLSGLTAPLAEAVLSRVTVVGQAGAFVGDERSSGKRRLDAAVDLLLGRTGRPAGECAPAGGVPAEDPIPSDVLTVVSRAVSRPSRVMVVRVGVAVRWAGRWGVGRR